MIKSICIFIFIAIIFSSCIPEENPVNPKDRGDLQSGFMEQSIYDVQGFYDLSSNKFISYNLKGSWDIAFDCNNNYIIINGARPVKAAFVDFYDFEMLTDKNLPDSMYIDEPNGDLNKSSFGQWWIDQTGNNIKKSKVFYIDRGRDERRKPLGTYKFQIIDWDEKSYTFKYCDIKKLEEITIKTIQKVSDYNFVYFNFSTPDDEIIVEPKNNEWDLLFTENTEYVPLNAIGQSEEEEAIPYQVRGVYLNPNLVEAVEFENIDKIDFNDLSRDDVSNVVFSKKLNVIGYDWKNFSLQGEVYAVDPNRIYIIKDTEGFIYKFRFISFFSEKGERGFTSFEIQQL